jgi:ABC-2 type transport system permease protein
VVAGPANLKDSEAKIIDQFVMRGGALVMLAGKYRLAPSQGGLAVEKVTTGLENALGKWGVHLGDEMVLDTKNDAFPIPVNRDVGNGMTIREVKQLPYPFFVKVDGDRLGSSVITSSISSAVLHWTTYVKAEAKVGDDVHTVETLLSSSPESWLTTSLQVEPNMQLYPDTGFAPPKPDDKRESRPLAVAITGGFTTSGDKKGAQHSPPDTRMVVIGSSAFASDDVLGLAQQLDAEAATTNVELVHAAVDWALADTDLLEIRSHTAAQRAIKTPPDDREKYRTINIVIAIVGLGLVVGLSWLRRRAVTPFGEG